MNVELLNYTGAGTSDPARFAANILLFTKGTRLSMDRGRMAEISEFSQEKVMDELTYMANTLPSSWEFVDYTFLISDVTRAFTHQLVRTRTGSYAQQAQRIAPMEQFGYETGPTIYDKNKELYDFTMKQIADAYQRLVFDGVAREDARGLLPTNIHTNIVAKFNLRTLADTVRKRSSGRVQEEYRSVVAAMKAEVLRVHPWATLFLDRTADQVALELQEMIDEAVGGDFRLQMIKRLDQLRGFLG